MTFRRLLANVLAAVVLAIIWCALVAVIIDERLSRQVSANVREIQVQNVPSGGVK